MAEHASERLTRRARQALHFANEEAQALNHSYVGAEHILLGLVREGAGVAAWVLDDMGVRLIQARETVAALVDPGDGEQRTNQQLSNSARSVIAYAMQEADRLGHAYVGTEHLLLGLLRDTESVAIEVLSRMGASLDAVRAQVMDVVSDSSYSHATAGRAERMVGMALAPSVESPVAPPVEPPIAPPPPQVEPQSQPSVAPSHPAVAVSRARLTSHVLDTAQGRPAANLRIELWWLGASGDERTLIKTVTTNSDGRTDEPLLAGEQLLTGVYELVFAVGDYFVSQGLVAGSTLFLDNVPIRFGIADAQAHYHVPLLVSPWAYSTYRGS